MRLIDADELLEAVDEERNYLLLSRGLTGAEQILVHIFRNLIEDAPTVNIVIPRDESDYLGGKNYST